MMANPNSEGKSREYSRNKSNLSVTGKRLEIRGLRKVYRTRHRSTLAVDTMDLSVEPGEFLVLLGPSGCGKSTLLELLAGLETPDAGSISLGGKLLCDGDKEYSLTPKERRVAMVFQSYALYPHLTVAGNIAFPLEVAGQPSLQIEAAVMKAAQSVQIESLLQSKPAELSGGQRQRVAIARALVREPDLLLMDEPLSNLDARLRLSTRAKIKALQRSLGVTTLYVTHDQQEAMALGDRIVILNRGRIEQIGTPEQIFNQPATAFAAGFTGHPPMNLLRLRKGRNASGESVWVLPDTDWTWPLSGMDGETALLGIRPEHIELLPSGEGETRGIPVLVEANETFGREVLVQLSVATQIFSALIARPAPSPEANLWARLDPDKVLIFPDLGQDPEPF